MNPNEDKIAAYRKGFRENFFEKKPGNPYLTLKDYVSPQMLEDYALHFMGLLQK